MKTLLAFFYAALFLVLPGLAQAQDAAEASRIGTMKIVRGHVAASQGREQRPLLSGDAVQVEDRLQTGAESAASLVLRDGTTLVLGANSQLDLRSFSYVATTQEGSLFVHLLHGSMRMLTGLIGKTEPSSIKVTTPTSTIGILGTDFIVQVDGPEESNP